MPHGWNEVEPGFEPRTLVPESGSLCGPASTSLRGESMLSPRPHQFPYSPAVSPLGLLPARSPGLPCAGHRHLLPIGSPVLWLSLHPRPQASFL